MLADVVLQALAFELFTQGGGTAALPNNGIVDGAAGFLIPHDGGLALIGDADAAISSGWTLLLASTSTITPYWEE